MSLGLGVGYYGLGGEDMASSVSTDLKQATSGAAAGLALWLKNDTGVTAAKWTDSSGYNNHATQSTEANQAAVSGGGLDFEAGNSQHYDLTNAITIADNSGFCIAAVITLETANNATLLGKDAFDQFSIKNTNVFRFRSDTNDTTTLIQFSSDGSTFPVSTKMLVLLNRSAGASNRFTFFKNGTLLTADTDTSSNEAAGENPDGFDIKILGAKQGTSQFFDGIIHELAFWQRGLTTQEITDVNTDLVSRHGL